MQQFLEKENFELKHRQSEKSNIHTLKYSPLKGIRIAPCRLHSRISDRGNLFIMEAKTYSEKLKDPRWQRKRLEILSRDNFTCRHCKDSQETLHVHHLKYHKEPWDVDSEYLITLCEWCHELETLKYLNFSVANISCLKNILKDNLSNRWVEDSKNLIHLNLSLKKHDEWVKNAELSLEEIMNNFASEIKSLYPNINK